MHVKGVQLILGKHRMNQMEIIFLYNLMTELKRLSAEAAQYQANSIQYKIPYIIFSYFHVLVSTLSPIAKILARQSTSMVTAFHNKSKQHKTRTQMQQVRYTFQNTTVNSASCRFYLHFSSKAYDIPVSPTCFVYILLYFQSKANRVVELSCAANEWCINQTPRKFTTFSCQTMQQKHLSSF